ncbi:energy transducer TonB family protein [Paracoccus beibuensis]|uniref:energy transducer TonB family protein n=1 Tax=Paracoccus beibuensis TaxID=547602 RepID=UPI00223EDF5B|nr:energy transducer TonB [Paracoccus beibuensis]
MIPRRTLETAGFFTIAAALHVSAAAILLPDQLQRGEAADAPPAALAAGGEEVRSMVSEWETPPEIETAAEPVQPQQQPEPIEAPEPVSAEEPPVMAAAAPSLSAPETPPVQPNLPEPPEPAPIDPAQLDLPDLRPMDPPEIEVESQLALDASSRPLRRPEPQPEPEPRREPAPEPQRQQAAERSPAPAAVQPAQRAGQGGQSQASSQGGSGGGVSAATRANAMSQWGGQIRSCINRRVRAPRGLRQGGTVVLAINVSRSGAIQGIGVAGSSGQPAVDQAVADGARRAGRCPSAPDALTDSVYSFTLPIQLDLR